uniref:Uncharacterized protein n=1 Tax=Arundo donax TaxID=35708 RepID=A0A0A9G9D3_ARUDO
MCTRHKYHSQVWTQRTPSIFHTQCTDGFQSVQYKKKAID